MFRAQAGFRTAERAGRDSGKWAVWATLRTCCTYKNHPTNSERVARPLKRASLPNLIALTSPPLTRRR